MIAVKLVMKQGAGETQMFLNFHGIHTIGFVKNILEHNKQLPVQFICFTVKLRSSIFFLKCPVPKLVRSNVVYSIIVRGVTAYTLATLADT